ncbi:uncharacterized protein LOC120626282 [Pararge aegeria]|uniref:uncharacterized protein LOC120626282 n=1 Tax=Pararge aegeria TaxID=116150 RepID=UPI0019D2DE72|nr:uncharacterized protein LOC120626282 [Pararge aegeria]
MWKELQNSPAYFLLLDREQRYHIVITDYITIWEVYYTEDELINRLMESNIGLEMDKSELLDKGYKMLQKPSELKKIKVTVDGQKLSVSMTMLGFPLKLSISLEEGSRELFFQKITQPAMKIIQDLRSSQLELRKMLITKDDEIEEYKSFGGKIRYTAIAPFNENAHMEKHCMYSVNFGDAELPLSILDRKVDVHHENPKIKQETIETQVSVKLEPVSQQTNAPNLANLTNIVKKEIIKTELLPARKRKLNL